MMVASSQASGPTRRRSPELKAACNGIAPVSDEDQVVCNGLGTSRSARRDTGRGEAHRPERAARRFTTGPWMSEAVQVVARSLGLRARVASCERIGAMLRPDDAASLRWKA